jgi:hypothetical protein
MYIELVNQSNNASMMTTTEDCIAADLGLPYDYAGKLSENTTKETFKSFFKFFDTEFFGVELDDKITGEEHLMVGFVQSGQYWLCTSKFTIKLIKFNHTLKEKWDLIYIACSLYLDLDVEIDENIYDLID